MGILRPEIPAAHRTNDVKAHTIVKLPLYDKPAKRIAPYTKSQGATAG
jgi:hypothetical protein